MDLTPPLGEPFNWILVIVSIELLLFFLFFLKLVNDGGECTPVVVRGGVETSWFYREVVGCQERREMGWCGKGKKRTEGIFGGEGERREERRGVKRSHERMEERRLVAVPLLIDDALVGESGVIFTLQALCF